MKYSQFLEARKILKSQGLSFNDIKDKPADQLNEFFGINKAIKSMVLKGVWGKKLENNKQKLSTDLNDQVKRSIGKLVQAKKSMKQGENTQAKNLKIESEIVKIINELSSKLVKLKTTELYRRIDSDTKLKQGAKDALKYSWEVMVTEVRVDILAVLLKDKVITDDMIINKVKQSIKTKDAELKEKGNKAEKEMGDTGDEEGATNTKEVNDILDDGSDEFRNTILNLMSK